MKSSAEINELATALAKAQGVFPPVKQSQSGQLGNRTYKYADLAAIKEATKKPLAENGLSITSVTEVMENGQYVLASRLLHASGQWISATYPLTGGLSSQERGSEITYGRRYLTSALLDIVTESDDDGAAATEAHKKGNGAAKQPPPTPPAKPTPQAPAARPAAPPERPKVQEPAKPGVSGENLLPVNPKDLVTIEILRVAKRPGKEPDGRKWTRYGIQFRTEQMNEPEWLNTFEQVLGDKAEELGISGQLANAVWKQGKVWNGKPSLELIHIEPA